MAATDTRLRIVPGGRLNFDPRLVHDGVLRSSDALPKLRSLGQGERQKAAHEVEQSLE